MSEYYNIFKVLNFKEKETIHSAMIAAIASYNRNSRKLFFSMLQDKAKESVIGGAFEGNIDDLITSIDFNSNEKGHWIKNEVQLWESVNRKTGKVSVNRGRADIWIGTNREIWKGTDGKDETKQYRLIIENKINAGNQDHQLRRYYRYLTGNDRINAGLFFLCVKNCEYCKQQAEDSAKRFDSESGDKREHPTKYSIITYEKDIKDWLEDVMKTVSNEDFLKVVRDYKELVDELVDNWNPKRQV